MGVGFDSNENEQKDIVGEKCSMRPDTYSFTDRSQFQFQNWGIVALGAEAEAGSQCPPFIGRMRGYS